MGVHLAHAKRTLIPGRRAFLVRAQASEGGAGQDDTLEIDAAAAVKQGPGEERPGDGLPG